VLHLQFRIERDSSAGARQPIAQLDVFDGWTAIAFIEAAVLQENLTANGAAPSECRSFPLVPSDAQKNASGFVLREKVFRGGGIVIRSNQRVEL